MADWILEGYAKSTKLLRRLSFGAIRTASRTKVEAFEREHGITLPDEYRDFILNIRNGGPGPNYGLFPFEESLKELDWDEDVSLFLQTPFPYEQEYQLTSADYADDVYSRCLSGTLVISHHGCGYFDFLVISGPQRGIVWHDFTDADGRLIPTGKSFNRSFSDWLKRAGGG